MCMSRKNYVAIAAALKQTRDSYNPGWNPNLFRALNDASKTLADYLESDNPRFDRARFLTACGVE